MNSLFSSSSSTKNRFPLFDAEPTAAISNVGTASGLVLGVATTLKIDVLHRWVSGRARELLYFCGLTLTVVLAAFVLLLFNLGSAIMDWSFLSMGLRGAILCFPLLFTVFLSQYDLRRAGALLIIVVPAGVMFTGIVQFDLLEGFITPND